MNKINFDVEKLFEVEGQKREKGKLYYVKFDGKDGNLCVYKVAMSRGKQYKEKLNQNENNN